MIVLGSLTAGLILIVGILLNIPSLRSRLTNKFDDLRVKVQYALNPPQEAVFVPQQEVADIVAATMAAYARTSTPAITQTPDLPTATLAVSPTPVATATPLPKKVALDGIRYQDQHGLWNYCAPATLAMELSYWGWQGDRTTIGPVVKPFEKDKNVMPYEMQDYIQTNTNLKSILRYGGTLETLKALIAEGFPVLIEKGIIIPDYNGKLGWVGHYGIISGYDDARQEFTTQDSYFQENYIVSYTDLAHDWQAFNNVFLVAYSEDRETQLMQTLGAYADESASLQIALKAATDKTAVTQNIDQFFAYFNRASTLVQLADYHGAADAYDMAFSIMGKLPQKDRPWRIMWYQTGPYFAYYFSGRYQDVEDLATTTIDAAAEPYLEESFVWRARARIALGDSTGAVEDIQKSLEYHPGFGPSIELAQSLGIQP